MRISLELFSLPLDSGTNIPFIKSGKIQSKLNLRPNKRKLEKQQNSWKRDFCMVLPPVANIRQFRTSCGLFLCYKYLFLNMIIWHGPSLFQYQHVKYAQVLDYFSCTNISLPLWLSSPIFTIMIIISVPHDIRYTTYIIYLSQYYLVKCSPSSSPCKHFQWSSCMW